MVYILLYKEKMPIKKACFCQPKTQPTTQLLLRWKSILELELVETPHVGSATKLVHWQRSACGNCVRQQLFFFAFRHRKAPNGGR